MVCKKDLDPSPGNEIIASRCSFGTTSENTASFSFVKPECAEREKGDLVMRPCVKSLGPRGISRVEKAHLSCCEMRNELRECESGAQIGVFSLTDFYTRPISEAIR